MTESAIDRGPVQDLVTVHPPLPRVTAPASPARPAARHAARPPAPHPEVRRGRLVVLLAVAALTYLADVASKVAVVALLDEDSPVQVSGTGISLRLIRNPGAAFGLGVNVTALFTAITVLVIVAILRTSRRLGSVPWSLTLGLLLGGALGNLTDRVTRSPGPLSGQVIDFVEIPGWPIFNVADLSICIAGALMVTLACRNVPVDGGPRRY